jgi:1,4-alpha-glucan branching enzyme
VIAKKQYLKSRPICKVKFTLKKEEAEDAKSIFIVGDFNAWNKKASPLKKLKNGSYTITLNLPIETEYQFRFLLDGDKWKNDSSADKYVAAPYVGIENSVVLV